MENKLDYNEIKTEFYSNGFKFDYKKAEKKCPKRHSRIVKEILDHKNFISLPFITKLSVEQLQSGRMNNGDGLFLENIWNHLYKGEELKKNL